MQRFQAFRCRYPEIVLLILTDSELLNLVSGDVNLPVYYGEGTYPGLIVELLISNLTTPVCSLNSPSGEHPRQTPNDLFQFTLLQGNGSDEFGNSAYE